MSDAAQNPRIVILTGAGISAESGLGTFRDADGLWEKHNIEDVATPEGYARNPELVHEFYNARRRGARQAAPNAAHEALAQLQDALPGEVLLVTQNIDDLHERAGSSNVLHMHGELFQKRCDACQDVSPHFEELTTKHSCDACGASGRMRPHVVWFGEMPLYMEEIWAALETAELFVSIGTSGQVYPAAGFVQHAHRAGADTLELNLEPTSAYFRESRNGPATQVVPEWVAQVIGA